MKKKIVWITPDCFLDTDIYIVPLLCDSYQIDWYILYKSELSYHDTIEKFKLTKNINIKTIRQTCRQRSIQMLFSYLRLFSEIRRNKYDLIYMGMFGFPYFHLLSPVLLNRNKIIMAAHNVSTPKGATDYWFAKLYSNYILAIFKHFHTFSNSQYNELLKKHPTKDVLMAPFMLKDYGNPTVQKSDLITFLSFGNIREYKRIDVLIEAAQNTFVKTRKKFRVIIAGTCNEWEKYEKIIKYPELFDLRIGRVDDKEIPNLFGESHYFVTPYQDIAQSGSVIVSINYECPVISSDLEAFREYIEEGKTGYFIKPASVSDLTKIMTHIIEADNKMYSTLRNGVVDMKKNRFSTNAIVTLYKNFIDKTCKIPN